MAVVKEKGARENAAGRTFREVRSEMKKVVWPTREETFRLTIVVIMVSIVIGAILFSADVLFTNLMALLRGLVS
ncbi:MAG: preprotein translocase subunit SecE [Chloroflexi bacterium AL-W]|nr:preprotein translocase subunit SecE [Chloroflexi bacterium AL-N1]NOK70547.1 preprotein translocase subunit SecE [Chloroflexi bacterium AL-N10]NOK77539.1 preprotein translocase subunit SecE [Chloroflexi bacterium AL-N5]NOK84390.1 preprotein translocase subunit SecE [Chloroflexi bacterium AL-W]NOK92279.1 preprotein translocase subunit SecE [Chloroflexi bacterium AL-N15]